MLSGRCPSPAMIPVNVGGEPPAEFAMWKLRRRRRRGHASPAGQAMAEDPVTRPTGCAPALWLQATDQFRVFQNSDCLHVSSEFRRLSHRCREKLARNVHASFNSFPFSFNSHLILVSVIEAAGRSGFGNREGVDLAMHALTQHDPAAPVCVTWFWITCVCLDLFVFYFFAYLEENF